MHLSLQQFQCEMLSSLLRVIVRAADFENDHVRACKITHIFAQSSLAEICLMIHIRGVYKQFFVEVSVFLHLPSLHPFRILDERNTQSVQVED